MSKSNIDIDGSREDTPKSIPSSPKKKNYWTLKITIVSFFLAAFFSFVSEIVSQKTDIIIASLVLILLVIIAIVFDAIGVAVTSCELAPLTALASRKQPGAKLAIRLVNNAEKVSNIMNDVIGDICGIISGSCSVVIVMKIIELAPSINQMVLTIALSSLVAALTVGGKAYLKYYAVKNSKDMVMFFARILSIFVKEKNK